ncbi:MAG: ATP-binding protein [Deltaproteobacteria bacterium]|nr:ATP-binding protein [Deltaproteobacteria bacterium]
MTKLGPRIGKQKAHDLWIAYKATKDQSIERYIHMLARKKLSPDYFEDNEILLDVPQPEQTEGDYCLGRVYHGQIPQEQTFGLRRAEIIRHTSIFGSTGSGKTNTGLLLVLNLLRDNVPFMIFDWKRNYRDLLDRENPRLRQFTAGKEILVFTVGKDLSPFYFNPMIPPPGVSQNIWNRKLMEIMGDAYFLGFGVFDILEQYMDGAACFRDVHNVVITQTARGRRADWWDSTMRALRRVSTGDISRMYNVRRPPMPIPDLLKRNVIFEMEALPEKDKPFFVESLLLWIHHYRLNESGPREKLKHMILIEEAHHMMSRKKEKLSGEEPITDILIREIREFGEGVVVIDQEPSKISTPALNNTYTTIGMSMKYEDNINALGAAMALDYKKRKYFNNLDTGFGIVKLQGRGLYSPFLVRFPEVKIRKGAVTNEMLREWMPRFDAQQVEIEAGPQKQERPSKKEDGEGHEGGINKELSPEEQEFLADVILHANDPVYDRYSRLGWSPHSGGRIKGLLIQKGLINEKMERTGEGWFKRVGLIGETKRKGGPVHELVVNAIRQGLKRDGWRFEIDFSLGGGQEVDLVAFKGNQKAAFEIESMECGKAKVQALLNVRKCLDAGFDPVISVGITEKAVKRLNDALVKTGLDSDPRVKVRSFGEFWKELKNNRAEGH